ncbi:hypothetical protein OOT46_20535 [Aquabacterium sp. A7-Y]|uniref:hypothetical protein n=1 Tax=Aquabacterium sp. A7-Y TaxID=1349605 RepID=UPI00223D0733|nr:hypothetical protein [Aquabacterium sp. A7-Y]MCW7540225.1 hypothetical protein [Aquabacterium sp. A7-Y]
MPHPQHKTSTSPAPGGALDAAKEALRQHPAGTLAGGVAGMAAGVVGGMAAGPVGSLAGAVVGAATGAAMGGAAGRPAGLPVDEDDTHRRSQHAAQPYAAPERPYEHYAPAYRYGSDGHRRHASAQSWNDVASPLEQGWAQARGDSPLEWREAAPAVRASWERARSRPAVTGELDPSDQSAGQVLRPPH